MSTLQAKWQVDC